MMGYPQIILILMELMGCNGDFMGIVGLDGDIMGYWDIMVYEGFLKCGYPKNSWFMLGKTPRQYG